MLLRIEEGKRLPITHWENVIGRSKRSDIIINVPSVAKTHSVLTRYDDGSWSITASDSVKGICVNGQVVECAELMSKGGAIFTGVNELNDKEETIVCYYTKRQ